jgi:outer membrane biosynthesis protein TonB
VEAVTKWRFSPAEKDGQPVAVELGVQVDFHLY